MSATDLLPNEITCPCFPWRQDRCLLSYGLPFSELVEAHVNRLHRSRVFAVVSGSLARNTDHFERLKDALGGKLVGEHIGFPSHVPWNEILKLVKEVYVLKILLAVFQVPRVGEIPENQLRLARLKQCSQFLSFVIFRKTRVKSYQGIGYNFKDNF